MTMFALVSTVDTIEEMSGNRVMLFRTIKDAEQFAALLLCTYYEPISEAAIGYTWATEHYSTAAELLTAFNESLSPTEYFHVFPVHDAPTSPRELFLDRDHESFVRSIEVMNQMYRLQVSTIPTLTFVDNKADGTQHTVDAVARLSGFQKTLQGELDEIEMVIKRAKEVTTNDAGVDHFVGVDSLYQESTTGRVNKREMAIRCITETADLLADIIVYCVSEMRKFGLPPAAIMAIVMQSNMSKLQPDGSAKYDDNGKFLKGPNYFPPEPKLKELITKLLAGHDPVEAQPKS